MMDMNKYTLLCPWCRKTFGTARLCDTYRCTQCKKDFSPPSDLFGDAYCVSEKEDLIDENGFFKSEPPEKCRRALPQESESALKLDARYPSYIVQVHRPGEKPQISRSLRFKEKEYCVGIIKRTGKKWNLTPASGCRNRILVDYRRVIECELLPGHIVTVYTENPGTSYSYIFTDEKLEPFSQNEGCCVEVDHLKAQYGKREVLFKDAECSFEPGKVYAIIGGSGVGKTTFMSILIGRKREAGGKVWFVRGEKKLSPGEAAEQNMFSFVPQDNALHEELSLYKGLEYIASLIWISKSKAERKAYITRALRMVAMEGEENLTNVVGSLSGGQRKRANIAAALIEDPRVLFLDEPTAGLDPENEEKIIKVLKEQASIYKKTVVLITHSPLAILRADKIVAIRKNKQVYFGTLDEVKEQLEVSGSKDGNGRDIGAELADLFAKLNSD